MDIHVNDQADGRLDKSGDQWQVRFERRLAHRQDKVWRALTEPEHRDAWFPQRIEADRGWVAGAPLRFVSDDMPEANFDGELLVYDPPRTLEMRWGEDLLRFELAADGDGTILTLINTFAERGTAARTAAGWHTCLDTLAYALAGQGPPWTGEERWRKVHPSYISHFGPEAATIGPPGGHPVLDQGT
ncbi:MAG TPA: SRPBCC family protein [Streptosporangiaceae bacterium]|nr:SRPBCC family protein [Streptosporangiaceae bacterium]